MNFEKSVHTALWGSESWEISAHPSDPSVIADGEEEVRRLNEIYPNFPLLFKIIDAKTRLSVQVHPNEETCKVTGGEPKTEMWCALSDGPIYAGLGKGTSAADVEAAVKSGRFEELLVRHEAKFGDVFFIPGGLVHAIGDGVKLSVVERGDKVVLTFPPADREDDVLSYRIEASVREGIGWHSLVKGGCYSQFYLRPSERKDICVREIARDAFQNELTYRFTVTPVGTDGVEGSPLQADWTTLQMKEM